MALASLVCSVPMVAAEILSGHGFVPSLNGWLITLFIAFGPSLTGQICYMRGVDLIGPARAGLAANLIPLTGAFCAIVVLHERFTIAHGVALGLGLGGISLAEWSGRRARLAPSGPERGRCVVQGAEPAGDPRLPGADQRRHAELHDEAEQHAAARHGHDDETDETDQTAEGDDQRQQADAIGSGLDLRDRLPEGEADAQEQAGQVAHLAVERDADGAIAGHRAAEDRAREPGADRHEAAERDGELEKVSFRRGR
jgi:Permeases of the drug/metabolite transporter (DMT) superfamily